MDRLASRSDTTFYVINEFEKSGRVAPMRGQSPDFDAVASIRAALEAAGVEFIEENGGGPGVRLRKVGTESD